MKQIITYSLFYQFFITLLLISEQRAGAQVIDSCSAIVLNAPLSNTEMIFSLYPDSNWGPANSGDFIATAWTFLGNPGVERTLMQVDLSSIPAGATITSASLTLYGDSAAENQGLGQYGPNTSSLRRITSSWNPYKVTWNTAPNTTLHNAVTLPHSTSAYENYPDIDVTNMVQDMIDSPLTSYGLYIQLDTEVYYNRMRFCSSINNDSALRPMLYICYVDSTSGINVVNSFSDLNVSIYPNPSSNELVLKCNLQTATRLNIIFYDLLGRVVNTISTRDLPSGKQTIDLSNYNQNLIPGMYLLKLTSAKGDNITKSFIRN